MGTELLHKMEQALLHPSFAAVFGPSSSGFTHEGRQAYDPDDEGLKAAIGLTSLPDRFLSRRVRGHRHRPR